MPEETARVLIHDPRWRLPGTGLVRALGWVSIGVGLAAVATLRPLMDTFGLGDRPNLGSILGTRDLVLGTGLLLGQNNTAAWCRARGIADALDVAIIIVGAASGAFRRDRAPIGVASGAGFSALSFCSLFSWCVAQRILRGDWVHVGCDENGKLVHQNHRHGHKDHAERVLPRRKGSSEDSVDHQGVPPVTP
jgi:hypothetical protein